jgi:hypothetical protein
VLPQYPYVEQHELKLLPAHVALTGDADPQRPSAEIGLELGFPVEVGIDVDDTVRDDTKEDDVTAVGRAVEDVRTEVVGVPDGMGGPVLLPSVVSFQFRSGCKQYVNPAFRFASQASDDTSDGLTVTKRSDGALPLTRMLRQVSSF